MDKELQVSVGIDQPKADKRKNILQELEELKSEGKTSTPEFTAKMRELEGVLGVRSVNPFGTNELEIFIEDLNNMSNADMQSLAGRVGLSPTHERPLLKKILIKEFKAQNRNNMRNVMPGSSDAFQLDPNNPKHAEAIEILKGF